MCVCVSRSVKPLGPRRQSPPVPSESAALSQLQCLPRTNRVNRACFVCVCVLAISSFPDSGARTCHPSLQRSALHYDQPPRRSSNCVCMCQSVKGPSQGSPGIPLRQSSATRRGSACLLRISGGHLSHQRSVTFDAQPPSARCTTIRLFHPPRARHQREQEPGT